MEGEIGVDDSFAVVLNSEVMHVSTLLLADAFDTRPDPTRWLAPQLSGCVDDNMARLP